MTYLLDLFEAHGVTCVTEKGWVVPNSTLPALRPIWYPQQASGRLDIQILVRDGMIIEECFAGVGQGESAIRDALWNFTINSFHVLLAAFWEKNDPEQVTTESWVINGKPYIAYIGNFGTRSSEGVTAHIPENFFASIEETIKSEQLTADTHWFRLFFCNFERSFTFEALKDNEIWHRGVQCLENTAWRQEDSYYSVRVFMVLCAA